MTGTCRCGSPFLRLFDDLGCVACGRQCCWGCAVVIEAVAYCVRCAEVLLEVSPSSAGCVVRPARREPHFLEYAPLIRAAHSDDGRPSRQAGLPDACVGPITSGMRRRC